MTKNPITWWSNIKQDYVDLKELSISQLQEEIKEIIKIVRDSYAPIIRNQIPLSLSNKMDKFTEKELALALYPVTKKIYDFMETRQITIEQQKNQKINMYSLDYKTKELDRLKVKRRLKSKCE